MKNQKNERGITLVALVVTIVVLLILAGITIMYVLQGDSIFSTARLAGTETNDAVISEILSSAVLEAQSQIYTGLDGSGEPTTLTSADAIATFISGRITNAGIGATVAITDKTYNDATRTFTLDGTITDKKENVYKVEVDTKTGKVSATRQPKTSGSDESGD